MTEVPWLAEVQTPPAQHAGSDTRPLAPLLVGDDGNPITTREGWKRRRASHHRQWLDFLGSMPARPPVRLTTLDETHDAACRRMRVAYDCEPGITVNAYVLYPEPRPERPVPGVVVFHSTTPDTIDEVAGVRGRDSRAIGRTLAEQGFVVFCPECYLWHDRTLDYHAAARAFQERHPGAVGMRKMLYDGQLAVDALSALDGVDPNRIGAAGHSLGAKETLYLAAFDERVKAAVASEGGIGLSFTNWHDPWYLGPRIRDPHFPLDHHQLLALIAPRAFLVIAGESGPPDTSVADGDRTWPYIGAALPVYRLFGDSARVGLFNHRQGHTIPDAAFDRLSAWLTTYL